MTHEQILKKAIEKAVDNGYSSEYIKGPGDKEHEIAYIFSNYHGYESMNIEHLIFSHDFAKAFWGDLNGIKGYSDGTRIYTSGWLFHLQQMVITEDPIKYLEKFL